jgi:hypothetical protein
MIRKLLLPGLLAGLLGGCVSPAMATATVITTASPASSTAMATAIRRLRPTRTATAIRMATATRMATAILWLQLSICYGYPVPLLHTIRTAPILPHHNHDHGHNHQTRRRTGPQPGTATATTTQPAAVARLNRHRRWVKSQAPHCRPRARSTTTRAAAPPTQPVTPPAMKGSRNGPSQVIRARDVNPNGTSRAATQEPCATSRRQRKRVTKPRRRRLALPRRVTASCNH